MGSVFLRRTFIGCSFQKRRLCMQGYASDCENKLGPPHIPVMVNEVIENIRLKEGDTFLDMTFGAGGHSSALLERITDLKVLALDRDPVAQEYAEELREKYPTQITPLEGTFSDLPVLLRNHDIKQNSIDGILFDLGCSSMQFDTGERGFSISKEGPLDMRMDGNRVPNQLTAADVITYASEIELYKIMKIYGEEKYARKLARLLVEARINFKPLQTTRDLCDLISIACGDARFDKLMRKAHASTKVFQALRIFVNNELNELNYGLLLAQKYLKVGGRAVAISFHSLEDIIVKKHFHNFFDVKDYSQTTFDCAYDYYSGVENQHLRKVWQSLHKKVVLPSDEEVLRNPRSRSAKLRAAIKVLS